MFLYRYRKISTVYLAMKDRQRFSCITVELSFQISTSTERSGKGTGFLHPPVTQMQQCAPLRPERFTSIKEKLLDHFNRAHFKEMLIRRGYRQNGLLSPVL